MATRRSTLSIAAAVILAVACSEPPTGVAPSFHRDGGGRTVVVDPAGRGDATTIQAGIDMAPDGGRVQVKPGTYNEAVVINKGLTLEAARRHGDDDDDRGQSGAVIVEQVVTTRTGGAVITITTSQAVVIRGLTIRHVGGPTGISARPIGGANLTLEKMTFHGSYPFAPPVIGAGVNMSHNTVQSGGRARLVLKDSHFESDAAALRLFGDVDAVIEGSEFVVTTSCVIVSPTGTGGGTVPAGAVTNVDIVNNQFNRCGSNRAGFEGEVIRVEGTLGATTTGSVNIIGNTFRNPLRTAGDCNPGGILYEFYSGRIENNTFTNVVQDCASALPTARSLPAAIFVGSRTVGMPPANPLVRFNDFVGNSYAGLRIGANQPTSLDARCNWWGSASGPSGVGPGTGDAIVVEPGAARPVFTPFATGPVAQRGHRGDDDDDDDGDGRGSCRLDFSLWSAPVNLGPPINSAAGEFGGALSPDGLALYFNSNRPGSAGTDLWFSRRPCRECPWGPALNLGPTLNGPDGDGAPEFSPDGRLLFFVSSGRPDGFGLRDIYVSRRDDPDDDFGWGPPVNLGPYVNTSIDEGGVAYFRGARGGRATLYFHRSLTGAQGDNSSEIYAVELSPALEGREPAVAVAELNDPSEQDQAPAVRDDGREIIFSSSRAGGAGGSGIMRTDLWSSTRRSIRDAWSRPEYLGTPLNTTGTELDASLSRDGLVLLFFSGRAGGVGMNDIWMSTRTRTGHGDLDDDDD